MFPLVVVVHADEETRVKRLIKRGMDEADARARIAAQATEEQRRAVADVLAGQFGFAGELVEQARDLWYHRVLPFAHNLAQRTTARGPRRSWCPTTRRGPTRRGGSSTRLNTACGQRPCASTTSDRRPCRAGRQGRHRHPGDRRVAGGRRRTRRRCCADVRLSRRHRQARSPADVAVRHTDDAALWHKRFHGAADPGRPTNVHIRVDGWPSQQFALLFVDWLTANPAVQRRYLAVKRRGAAAHAITPTPRSRGSSTPTGGLGVGGRHRLAARSDQAARRGPRGGGGIGGRCRGRAAVCGRRRPECPAERRTAARRTAGRPSRGTAAAR